MLVLGMLFTTNIALAQGSFTLSKNADLSTDDRAFDRTDVLYILITAQNIDYADLDKNEFRLKPSREGNDIETAFTNNFDGTYSADLDLSMTDPNVAKWEWRPKIEDESGHKFEAKVDITIGVVGPDDEKDNSELEVKGAIESLGVDSLVVAGVTFFVDENTEVLNDDPIPFTDLMAGDFVEVKARQQADSTWLATRIKIEDGEDEDELNVTGPIEALGTDSLVVSGVVFFVDAETQILDNDNTLIDFGALMVGDLVEVEARLQADSTWLAKHVKLEDGPGDEVQVTGEITDLTDASITVSDVTFLVTNVTLVLDNDNNPIAFSDLTMRMIVEVEADVLADGTLSARKIKVEDRQDDEFEFTGTLEAISASDVTVAGTLFMVDAGTVILDNNENVITLADLMVGMLVEVKGTTQADGSVLATKIKIEDLIEDEVEVTGAIEALPDSAVVVQGRTFRIFSTTAILDNNNVPIDLSALAVGQVVEVRGELLPGDDLVALRIKQEDTPDDELRLVGPIDTIGMDSLHVLGTAFFIDTNTAILDHDEIPITLADLVVGQTVEVEAMIQAYGSLLATKVKVEDVSIVSGNATGMSASAITLLGTTYSLTATTLILNERNALIDVSALTAGQYVQVRGVAGAAGAEATKVKVFASVGTVTAVEDAPGNRLDMFVLEQNYPNPFTPSTTIRFTLNRQSDVRLKVYNVLGQEVSTLVSSRMAPGSHSVTWDARDRAGQPVAAGIYLYRISADGQSRTRQMVLIK